MTNAFHMCRRGSGGERTTNRWCTQKLWSPSTSSRPNAATSERGQAERRKMSAMNLTLHVWRQKDAKSAGGFERYDAKGISEHMSFLEMLDVVNERLIEQGKDPIAFDHDCR